MKDIGYGYYVTSDGQIFSSKTNRILKSGLGTNGRPLVVLSAGDRNTKFTKYVHVLVCEAFHGPRPPGMTVSHKDGNVLNNHPENLCWETQAENLGRKLLHGTHDKGFNNSRASVTPEDVNQIFLMRQNGHTHQSIADSFKLSRTTISRILNKQRFAQEVMPNEDDQAA